MTMPNPKAVIFDWDDTLVDTWGVVTAAINTTLRHMGHAEWSEEQLRLNIGPPARVLFTRLFGEDRWQEADKVYVAAYEAGIRQHLKIHAGAEETLKQLADSGVFMAVVSSKRGNILRAEAAHLGFDKYFSALVGAGDAPMDKPHAESVQHALQGSGLAAGADVLFIGDSLTDITCARNAGCTAVLIETKLPDAALLAKNPPDLRVANHAALQQQLAQLLPPDAKKQPAPPKPAR
ncbi:MAG: HAD family hydrolase [Micavibrio sp.]|nr:HAD family hydrolase [Micavibrio sp.]